MRGDRLQMGAVKHNKVKNSSLYHLHKKVNSDFLHTRESLQDQLYHCFEVDLIIICYIWEVDNKQDLQFAASGK